jgi:hypothetical protein
MQARIRDLLSQISFDDITGTNENMVIDLFEYMSYYLLMLILVDLLRYNDELNHSFTTFNSYMRERQHRLTSSSASQRTTTPVSSIIRKQDNESALIRFDDDPSSLTGIPSNPMTHTSK